MMYRDTERLALLNIELNNAGYLEYRIQEAQ